MNIFLLVTFFFSFFRIRRNLIGFLDVKTVSEMVETRYETLHENLERLMHNFYVNLIFVMVLKAIGQLFSCVILFVVQCFGGERCVNDASN